MAVALKYAPGTAAPTVVAKGRGLIAEEIISRARESGIFVHESPELVALLSQVDLDGQIPPSSTSPSPSCWHGSTGSNATAPCPRA
jgi:flagellar biosynthesis protein